MNVTAIWFCKEWRSQRGQLAAYLVLTLGLILLAGPLLWPGDARGDALRVGVCVYIGLIGALVFAAPQCARGEVNGRDDQLLRRLPGALRPAFAAKLLFVALAAIVQPLLGFTFGELTVCWRGFVGLDALLEHGPAVREGVPILLLSLPWVLAAAFVLPGGRMAVGVAAAFLFAIAAGYRGVLALHPGLGNALDPRPHVAWLSLLGLVVAAVAWLRGRRGGGWWRPAKLGLATLALGLLPSAAWLGAWVVEYRSPLEHLQCLDVYGISADRRYALATSPRKWDWPGVTYRVDLTDGRAEVLIADESRAVRNSLDNRDWGAERDLWLLDLHRSWSLSLLDLATGEQLRLPRESVVASAALPAGWRERFAAQLRQTTPFRQAGGRPAWLDGGWLHVAEPDGSVTVVDWPGSQTTVCWVGHAIAWRTKTGERAFDFASRRIVELPDAAFAFAVDGVWLIGPYLHRTDLWSTLDPATGELTLCPGLARDPCLGNLRDGEVLMEHRDGREFAGLFAFCPASGQRREIAWGDGEGVWSFWGSGGPSVDGWRDAEGRRWISGNNRRRPGTVIVAVDPATATATTILRNDLLLQLIAIEPDHTILAVEDCARLVRIDPATGSRKVVFARDR